MSCVQVHCTGSQTCLVPHSPGISTTTSWQRCQSAFWVLPPNFKTCKCDTSFYKPCSLGSNNQRVYKCAVSKMAVRHLWKFLTNNRGPDVSSLVDMVLSHHCALPQLKINLIIDSLVHIKLGGVATCAGRASATQSAPVFFVVARRGGAWERG